MAKVITFSRAFQKGHPKAGKPTYFVEQILNDLNIDYSSIAYYEWLLENNKNVGRDQIKKFFCSLNKIIVDNKKHTIRNGNRFKAGDFFSPRVWGNDINPNNGRSGPYHSKQIIIAPDTEVKKTFEVEIIEIIEGLWDVKIKGESITRYEEHTLAKNDGLSYEELQAWFKKLPFSGQVICWNQEVNYGK